MGVRPVREYEGAALDTTMIVKGTVGGSFSVVAIGCVETTDVAYAGGSGGMHGGNLTVRVVVSGVTEVTEVEDSCVCVCETEVSTSLWS